ncbi:hypothetical protein KG112_05630 [Nocardioides sp. zg-ZUI104]|uniref:transglutaminase family protein n=1 Tax=Nocardioides faecalis TaxID=2803858 RepID=UPI001BD03D55|nr:DUF3488 and transglutaminase-like domain-containing protein [Nocardioides faecalis]MBS4752288.1 hypothetical protein [Nocardioides faecalis]
MRAPTLGVGATLGIPALAAATTWVTLTAWRDFVAQPSSYLDGLAVVAVVVAGLGTLLRWRGAPRAVTVLAQAVAVAALVCYQVTGSPVFVGAPGAELWGSLEVAVDSARTFAAPIGPGAPPVWPLLLVSGAGFLLLVDVVAATLRRVPGAGLVLLAVYAVPSGLLEDGPGAAPFAVAALGFLLMLHLDSRECLRRWGRGVGPSGDDVRWVRTNPVLDAARAGAGRIGVGATVLALAVPAFIPTLGVDLLDLGNRSGDGDIRIRKPVADMRRDLERDVDIPMLTVETDDPSPSYLRISVLHRFTGQEWSSGDRDVAREDKADGELPAPAGMTTAVPRRSYAYEVRVTEDFDSTWLPTQFPAAAVTAEGDWRFDPDTMDFLAADDGDTRDLTYRMIGLEPRYGTDGRFFRDAATGAVPDDMLELPDSLPEMVRALAREVTDEATNDYERALLLQRWFRRDGGFVYDLRRAPDGTGNNTLEAFLSEDGRVGYCEQYASAMAVMARTLGIPARVAVGFLEPDRISPTTWEYSSHDLHAWPELYFAGAGWVRFEPTPAGRVDAVPAYTRVAVGGDADSDDPAAGPGGAQPSESAPTAAPSVTPSTAPREAASGVDDGPAGASGRTILVLLAALAGAVIVAGASLGPRALRRRQRQRRLDDGPEQVWAELRATAADLRLDWPEGRSPAAVGEALGAHLTDHGGEDATSALARIVAEVERGRYARPGSVSTLERTTLREDAGTVTAALEASAGKAARRRATWAPLSVWSGGREPRR